MRVGESLGCHAAHNWKGSIFPLAEGCHEIPLGDTMPLAYWSVPGTGSGLKRMCDRHKQASSQQQGWLVGVEPSYCRGGFGMGEDDALECSGLREGESNLCRTAKSVDVATKAREQAYPGRSPRADRGAGGVRLEPANRFRLGSSMAIGRLLLLLWLRGVVGREVEGEAADSLSPIGRRCKQRVSTQ